jgi:glucokinase
VTAPGHEPTGAAATIGVDLGGTKMLVGVVDERGDTVHRRVSASGGLSGEALLELLDTELRIAIEARPDVAAVGLGVPCIVDADRSLCLNSNHLPLVEVPLKERVAELTGLPVALDNDGNAAAVAELARGAAQGATDVVLLTIGTGIGGGLILGGRPFRGSRGGGAELGHVVVDINGPPCQGNCPNHGCIESIASGTALRIEAEFAAVEVPESGLGRAAAEGAVVDGRLVTELAQAGDQTAIVVIGTIGRRLGVALSGLANIFDPDVIVVGGGVMAAGDLLLGPARDEFAARALTPQNETPIRAAALGPDAGMIGAAILARDEHMAIGAGA